MGLARRWSATGRGFMENENGAGGGERTMSDGKRLNQVLAAGNARQQYLRRVAFIVQCETNLIALVQTVTI